MAENEGFGGDHLRGATSFSQLLLADDDGDGDVAVGLDVDRTVNYSVFSSEKPPKMLCFGNYQRKGEPVYSETTRTPPQKSGVTCSDSSSASSSNNSSINTFSKSAASVCTLFLVSLLNKSRAFNLCGFYFKVHCLYDFCRKSEMGRARIWCSA